MKTLKKYRLVANVRQVIGCIEWETEAESEEDALCQIHNGGGVCVAENIMLTETDEPKVVAVDGQEVNV